MDLANGKVVRLSRGLRDQETVYGDDPVAWARRWEAEGALELHLVNLDGAFDGSDAGENPIAQVVAAVDVPVQFGGGIRDDGAFRRAVELGVAHTVFGTVAVKEPAVVERALASDADRVALAVDVKDGRVAIQGWEELSTHTPEEFCRSWYTRGVRRFIYTDVSRDGVMEGVNVDASERLARRLPEAKIIASGGIGRLEDLDALVRNAPSVYGVIVGRALYERRFTLPEAMGRVD